MAALLQDSIYGARDPFTSVGASKILFSENLDIDLGEIKWTLASPLKSNARPIPYGNPEVNTKLGVPMQELGLCSHKLLATEEELAITTRFFRRRRRLLRLLGRTHLILHEVLALQNGVETGSLRWRQIFFRAGSNSEMDRAGENLQRRLSRLAEWAREILAASENGPGRELVRRHLTFAARFAELPWVEHLVVRWAGEAQRVFSQSAELTSQVSSLKEEMRKSKDHLARLGLDYAIFQEGNPNLLTEIRKAFAYKKDLVLGVMQMAEGYAAILEDFRAVCSSDESQTSLLTRACHPLALLDVREKELRYQRLLASRSMDAARDRTRERILARAQIALAKGLASLPWKDTILANWAERAIETTEAQIREWRDLQTQLKNVDAALSDISKEKRTLHAKFAKALQVAGISVEAALRRLAQWPTVASELIPISLKFLQRLAAYAEHILCGNPALETAVDLAEGGFSQEEILGFFGEIRALAERIRGSQGAKSEEHPSSQAGVRKRVKELLRLVRWKETLMEYCVGNDVWYAFDLFIRLERGPSKQNTRVERMTEKEDINRLRQCLGIFVDHKETLMALQFVFRPSAPSLLGSVFSLQTKKQLAEFPTVQREAVAMARALIQDSCAEGAGLCADFDAIRPQLENLWEIHRSISDLKTQYLRYQTKRGRARVQDEMIRKRALLAEHIVAIGWSDDQWAKWAAEVRAKAESVLRCKKKLEETLAVLSKREKRLRIAREELEHKMSYVSPEAVDTIARALARARRARSVLEAGGDRYVVQALCRFPCIMKIALRIVTWCHRGLKLDIYFSATDGGLGKKLDRIVTCCNETAGPTIPPNDHDERHRRQDNETRQEIVRRSISELPWQRDMISIWISEATQKASRLGSLDEETATIRTLERKIEALQTAYPDLFPERGNPIGGPTFAVRMEAAIRNIESELASIKDALVTTHRGLVWTMARRYRTLGVEMSDLAQEGMRGLLRALESFDPRRGYRFSTYATYWIRKFILRFAATQGRIIQLPVNQAEHVGTLMKAIQELSFELEREPSSEEIARRMQVPEREAREMMAMFRPTVSLDARNSENDTRELQEKLAGHTRNPEESLVQRSGEEMVGQLLEQLDPIKKEILVLRYFSDDPKRLSLAEMARRVCISKEKVLALEREALDELARRPEARQAGYLLGVLPAPRNGHQNVDGAISNNGKDYGHERK